MDPWTEIAGAISAASGTPFLPEQRAAVGGGCINSAWRISGGGRDYFVKTNGAAARDMFAAEAEGLRALALTDTLRVPRPICEGGKAGTAWLVLEYIAFGGKLNPRLLGAQLAALHRAPTPDARYGWTRDNTIGATPQINTWRGDWIAFWQDQRLGYQLKLAADNGAPHGLRDKGERLRADCGVLFSGYTPVPSLLHGDLWNGNAGYDARGAPVIFDPAVYYGDRETDVAMTELFGGFGADFYAGYNEAWPLDGGYRSRRTLYNLYHVLNHFNLFGGGYARQAEDMTAQLLAEIG